MEGERSLDARNASVAQRCFKRTRMAMRVVIVVVIVVAAAVKPLLLPPPTDRPTDSNERQPTAAGQSVGWPVGRLPHSNGEPRRRALVKRGEAQKTFAEAQLDS